VLWDKSAFDGVAQALLQDHAQLHDYMNQVAHA
jgi:hypothetical protein